MKSILTTLCLICLPFLLLAQAKNKKATTPKRALHREISFGAGIFFNDFRVMDKKNRIPYNQSFYRDPSAGGRLQMLFPVQNALKIGPAIEYVLNNSIYRRLNMLAIGIHFNAPIFIGSSNSYFYPGGHISYITANPYTAFGFGFHAGLNISVSPRSFAYIEPGMRFLSGGLTGHTFPVLIGMRFHL